MKYIVWGTGSAAENYILDYGIGYFYPMRNEIVAFVDNDVQKAGKKFFHKDIISPSQIYNYEFEKILICSSYEKEIKIQLINELNILPENIIIRKDMSEVIYEYFDKVYDLGNKKILFIADKTDEYVYKISSVLNYYFKYKVDILNIDSFSNECGIEYDFFFISPRVNMSIIKYTKKSDYIMSQYNTIKEISKKFKIDCNRILTYQIYNLLQSRDKRVCWGDKNPDKVFYVIKPNPGQGLVRNVQSAMEGIYYAKINGYIPVVDMYTYPTRYHEDDEIGRINAWEKFFEQPGQYNMTDAIGSKNVILSLGGNIQLPKHEYKGIIMKPRLKYSLDEFCKFFNLHKKVLGVYFRGTDYNTKLGLLHSIQPAVNQAINIVKEKIEEWSCKGTNKFDAIFLVTEDETAFNIFKDNFGDMLFYINQKRFPANCDNLIEYEKSNGQTSYDNGKNYWINIVALSKCNSMIAGPCGGSYMAECLNASYYQNSEQYENIYYFDYGIKLN